ncbi:hypothetical protein AAKU61_001121 [Undibacterium sp. GrIS 1.2]
MDDNFIHRGSINKIRDKPVHIESGQISNSISTIRAVEQPLRQALQTVAKASAAINFIFQKLGAVSIHRVFI